MTIFGHEITKKDHSLFEQWMEAKAEEKAATDRRRSIEDALTKEFDLDEQNEGSKTHKLEGYSCKITQRLNRKIDQVKLEEIAAEHGIEDQLQTLFRWKPELNIKAWKSSSEEITRPLADAITAMPGRPSYAITKEN